MYSFGLITLIVLGLEATLATVVSLFMGQSFLPAVEPVRWLLLGAIPYVTYMVVRGPLDALKVWPHNSINLTLALATVVSLMWFGSAYITAPVALLLSLLLLGVLSILSWQKILKSIAEESYCKVDDALSVHLGDA